MPSETLQIVVSGRQEGKTTHLVRWLLGGHLTDEWPGWSRLLLCHDGRTMLLVHEHHGDVDRELRDLGVGGGLGKLLLGPSDLTRRFVELQGRNGDLEIAVDNLDFWLERGFGIPLRLTLVSMTGEFLSPQEAP